VVVRGAQGGKGVVRQAHRIWLEVYLLQLWVGTECVLRCELGTGEQSRAAAEQRTRKSRGLQPRRQRCWWRWCWGMVAMGTVVVVGTRLAQVRAQLAGKR
jgi:hypothetical protein